MKEKFKRGSRVRVVNADERQPVRDVRTGDVIFNRPSHRDQFGGDEAVIVGSYRQLYGTDDWHQYALVVLDAAGKPVNRVSWYDEQNLALVNNDRMAGHDLIGQFDDYLDDTRKT